MAFTSTLKKTICTTVALIAWFAIVLQLYLSVNAYLAKGRTLGGALVEYFSFFTIQSNICVAIGLTAVALGGFNKGFFTRPGVLTAIAVYISIVCLVYNLVLRGSWHPQVWDRLADELLHVGNPLLFLLIWVLYVPKQGIAPSAAFSWLWYPLGYLIYIMIRGALCGIYPYFFLNAITFGYPKVLMNIAVLMLVFLAFSMLYVWIARLFAKRQSA